MNLAESPLVREILARLSAEMKEPRIMEALELILTDKDFDYRKRSKLDSDRPQDRG